MRTATSLTGKGTPPRIAARVHLLKTKAAFLPLCGKIHINQGVHNQSCIFCDLLKTHQIITTLKYNAKKQ